MRNYSNRHTISGTSLFHLPPQPSLSFPSTPAIPSSPLRWSGCPLTVLGCRHPSFHRASQSDIGASSRARARDTLPPTEGKAWNQDLESTFTLQGGGTLPPSSACCPFKEDTQAQQSMDWFYLRPTPTPKSLHSICDTASELNPPPGAFWVFKYQQGTSSH